MSTPALESFFNSSQYAVVGASTDPTKFGNKVLKWYIAHDLSVTPINPKEPTVESLPAQKSIEGLSSPSTTSISVIVPPKVAIGVLEKAFEIGISKVWLQPGVADENVEKWIKEKDAGGERVVFGGPCILASGEQWLNKTKGV